MGGIVAATAGPYDIRRKRMSVETGGVSFAKTAQGGAVAEAISRVYEGRPRLAFGSPFHFAPVKLNQKNATFKKKGVFC